MALELAQQYNGEIICADSRTIYRGMNIGTAKPTAAERRLIQHHGLDLVDPGQRFSAAEFKAYAKRTITEIRARGRLPFLVGGSGLYIDAVIFDYQFRPPVESQDFSGLNDTELVTMAASKYPNALVAIDSKNRRRVEQLLNRGPAQTTDRQALKKSVLLLGLKPDRLTLKQKIDLRTRTMLSNGFVQEVESLRARYGADCPTLRTIGYGYISDYLDGKLSLEEARQRFVQHDYQLAKRQLTWFARNPFIHWITEATEARQLIDQSRSPANHVQ